MYDRHFRPQHALTNAFAVFVGKSIEADQHGTDMITLAGLLFDNPGDELRAGGHQVPPALKTGPQPCCRPKHNYDIQSARIADQRR
jgi:hypothetical protein